MDYSLIVSLYIRKNAQFSNTSNQDENENKIRYQVYQVLYECEKRYVVILGGQPKTRLNIKTLKKKSNNDIKNCSASQGQT